MLVFNLTMYYLCDLRCDVCNAFTCWQGGKLCTIVVVAKYQKAQYLLRPCTNLQKAVLPSQIACLNLVSGIIRYLKGRTSDVYAPGKCIDGTKSKVQNPVRCSPPIQSYPIESMPFLNVMA